jgi:hypothetical protein
MIPHLTPKDKNLILFFHSQEINIDGEKSTTWTPSCSPQGENPYRNTRFPAIIFKKIIFTMPFLVLTK